MGNPTDDRRPPISGGTRLAAVIGAPVRHSLSPTLLNTAFAEAGLDWHFMALEVAEGQAGEALDAVRALGLVGPYGVPIFLLFQNHNTFIGSIARITTPSSAELPESASTRDEAGDATGPTGPAKGNRQRAPKVGEQAAGAQSG